MIATWAGWIASLPVKPSRAAAAASAPRPFVVAEVGENAVDRLDSGGDRGGQAQRARQLVGEGQLPVGDHISTTAPIAAERSSAPQLIAASGDLGSR